VWEELYPSRFNFNKDIIKMPRGGGGRSSGRSSSSSSRGYSSAPKPAARPARRPASPARSVARPAPVPAKPAAPAQQASSGPGLGSMVATGMAFGAGSAVAHQVVGGMMGSGGHGGGQVGEGGYEQQLPAGYEMTQEGMAVPSQLASYPCIGINSSLIQV
jgi:hypothetical protein